MKVDKPANVMLRVVGHRSRLNRHWRLSGRQWRVAVGFCGGVVPLLLAFGVYGLLGALIPSVRSPGQAAHRAVVVRGELASITRDTVAGLDVMGFELGALNSDAARLALLEQRLGRQAGVPVGFVHRRPAQAHIMPVSSPDRSHLMSKLRALAQELSPASHAAARRRAL